MDMTEDGCLRSFGPMALLAFLLVAGCSGSTGVPRAPTAAAPAENPFSSLLAVTNPGAAATLGTNLIANGGADQPFAGADCSLSGWQQNLELEATAYGGTNGEPTAASVGPPDRGPCYFRMPIGGSASEDPNTQLIDVSALATRIDSGTVSATLGGWFDGKSGANDDYNARFLDAKGSLVDVLPAQEVDLPTDPTALAQSVATVAVPAGTRFIEVNLTLNYDGDCSTCSSVAYADSLSLVLSGG